MLIHHGSDFEHWFDQLFWRQDITQAQGRIEDLTHSAGVDNTSSVIKPLQAREWRTGITKFRVMIVLENVSVAGARKVDQSRSSRETHRHTEWELMRRSDIDYFRRALFGRPRDCDSLPVNRPWNNRRPSESKSPASLVKSRVFDPRNLSSIYEGHCADHHRLLRSCCDDNLVWMTTRASVIAQISCERFAQLGVPTA